MSVIDSTTEATTEEIWKPVIGYEGIYSVSNRGRVRREIDGGGPFKKRHKAGTMLNPTTEKPSGRQIVILCKNAVRNRQKVHTLVLTAFVGPRPEGMIACHFPDRNPANNRIENLRWDTHAANTKDMFAHGTARIGEKNHNTKITSQIAMTIKRHIRNGLADAQIARLLKIHRRFPCDIRRGKTWKHITLSPTGE